ncbi:MAG: hypothetical protein ACXWJ1_11400 [Caldimonas sp.]
MTIDHWTTLLPVQRDGAALGHVFEDCAHWWALARASLIALDAIHELHLVHLDLKADNLCIPVGPADFDPHAPGALLTPDFERIALIDFAFSLVSGERLESALPIARQTEYDYQSPRLLEALEEGSRGNLWPTRQLDWRCDLFSLAAMLRRYLPAPEQPDGNGWTAERRALARALVRRLLEAHDAALPAQRPHVALIALAAEPLRDPELAASLQGGWTLGEHQEARDDPGATPITRIALPVAPAADAEPIIIDRSDIERRAAAALPRNRRGRRRAAWGLGIVAAAALSIPLLGEAWRAIVAPGEVARDTNAPSQPQEPSPPAVAPGVAPWVAMAPASVPLPAAPARATPVATSPAADLPAATLSAAANPVAASPEAAAPAASTPTSAIVAEAKTPPPAKASPPAAPAAVVARAPSTRRVASARPAPALRTPVVVARASPSRRATATSLRVGSNASARPASFQASDRALARARLRSPIYLPPAVGLAPLPTSAVVAMAASQPAPAVAMPPPLEDSAPAAPTDYAERANELLATQMPRIAQRAERMVLRVLFTAANAEEDGRDDDEVRLAAGAIRLAPDDPALGSRPAVKEARAFQDSARAAFRRGDLGEAVALQTRAFGADPVDAEIAGTLAFLRLKQGAAQAEAARRLVLHALTLHDWKHPAGRIEDWNTLAIASALSGHERDARNAWLVALALAGGSERQCRAAIDAVALYGEPLRPPVEAMLQRANASSRAPHSRLCEWPPHWSASNQLR